jgi:hypothetical protein
MTMKAGEDLSSNFKLACSACRWQQNGARLETSSPDVFSSFFTLQRAILARYYYQLVSQN